MERKMETGTEDRCRRNWDKLGIWTVEVESQAKPGKVGWHSPNSTTWHFTN
jgi:hypothetical protein